MPRVGLHRETLIEAAQALIAEGGMTALSMAALAAHFGVKPPSLYKHIDDLSSLRIALSLRGWQGLAETFAELGRAGADPRQLGRAWWRFAQAYPGIFEAAESAFMQDQAAVAAARARAEARAERIFEESGLHGDEAEHAWRALRVLVVGMVHLQRYGGHSELSIDASFSRALGALFRGWRRSLPE